MLNSKFWRKKKECPMTRRKNKLLPEKGYPSINFLNVIFFSHIDSISVRERTSKIIIDEEPSCHKFMHKLGLRNFIKSLSGMVILKNIKKSVNHSISRIFNYFHSHHSRTVSDFVNLWFARRLGWSMRDIVQNMKLKSIIYGWEI